MYYILVSVFKAIVCVTPLTPSPNRPDHKKTHLNFVKKKIIFMYYSLVTVFKIFFCVKINTLHVKLLEITETLKVFKTFSFKNKLLF